MESDIKKIRVKLDLLASLAGLLGPSAETTLAKRAFEVSKMFLGKVLQGMGTPNPYPESKNAASEKIEPTADASDVTTFEESLSTIGRVKHVRAEADKVCKELETLLDLIPGIKGNPIAVQTFVTRSFGEAQLGMMWLGMELSRLNGPTPEVKKESPKTLHNTTANQAKDNVKDIVFWGNGDTFKLISKASSKNEGWMKSSKAMEIPDVGCVVQVTTQQGENVAEAVTFVPGVKIKETFGDDKKVISRELVSMAEPPFVQGYIAPTESATGN